MSQHTGYSPTVPVTSGSHYDKVYPTKDEKL